jgi:hypothetical protein
MEKRPWGPILIFFLLFALFGWIRQCSNYADETRLLVSRSFLVKSVHIVSNRDHDKAGTCSAIGTTQITFSLIEAFELQLHGDKFTLAISLYLSQSTALSFSHTSSAFRVGFPPFKVSCYSGCRHRSWFCLGLLLLGSDIHLNPGPDQINIDVAGDGDDVSLHYRLRNLPRGMVIGHLNVRGLKSSIDELRHLLIGSQVDFLFLSETWLNPSSNSGLYGIPGYTLFRKDRTHKLGGGVALYAKEDHDVSEKADLNGMDSGICQMLGSARSASRSVASARRLLPTTERIGGRFGTSARVLCGCSVNRHGGVSSW